MAAGLGPGMLDRMSTSTPVSVSPQSALELGVGLDASPDRESTRRALIAITGLIVVAAVIAVGAAHTTALLPQSVQFVPTSLAGAFNGFSFNLHTGGAMAALALLFTAYVFVVSLSAQLSARVVLKAIAALNLLVLLSPPLVSTDVFSYQ